MQATLSIVGTPIGNLEDITLRAIRTLKESDLVLCEDTRVTKRLFERYEIKTKTLSYHEHSSITKVDQILGLLREGKHIALVTDSGMPTISDPGADLVNYVRSIPDLEVKVEVVPGPTALSSAISLSGLIMREFVFLGFLPHKKGRETALKKIAVTEDAVVLYESSHRIEKLMREFGKYLPTRKVVICKEMTKIHEEFIAGYPDEVSKILTDHSEKKKGEFVVIVSAA